jgi:hypothetical protein
VAVKHNEFPVGGVRKSRRVPRRLERLVESGRITPAEAERLREGDPGGVDDVVVGIRVRHASARLEAAVGAGELRREEADSILARLRAGEHSPELRAQVNRIARSGRRDSAGGGETRGGWSA